MDKKSCLVLFSGGLDSILAAKTLLDQGIKVTAISFKSCFYDTQKAREGARMLGIKIIEEDISEKMNDLVKNPPSGHGKNLNPCIDCHALMISKAGEYLKMNTGKNKREKYDFIATGEVLGQRPFSQKKAALARVQKLAGFEVLRPLSARLLPETGIEKSGLVKRENLLSISGRSRKNQIELAEKYGINKYPSASGGCLLTEEEFSERLKTMIDYWPKCQPKDIDLLKNGRIFWIKLAQTGNQNTQELPEIIEKNTVFALVVIGRNEKENNSLEERLQKGDFMIKLKELMGPIALIRFKGDFKAPTIPVGKEIEVFIPLEYDFSEINDPVGMKFENMIGTAAQLNGYYSTKARGKKIIITIKPII